MSGKGSGRRPQKVDEQSKRVLWSGADGVRRKAHIRLVAGTRWWKCSPPRVDGIHTYAIGWGLSAAEAFDNLADQLGATA